MQPYHAIDDARWAEQVIGVERASRTYAFRSLLDAKATVDIGMLAYFVLLERDITMTPPQQLRGVRVMRTVVGGRTVFERK